MNVKRDPPYWHTIMFMVAVAALVCSLRYLLSRMH